MNAALDVVRLCTISLFFRRLPSFWLLARRLPKVCRSPPGAWPAFIQWTFRITAKEGAAAHWGARALGDVSAPVVFWKELTE
jgi:hypothetical protein